MPRNWVGFRLTIWLCNRSAKASALTPATSFSTCSLSPPERELGRAWDSARHCGGKASPPGIADRYAGDRRRRRSRAPAGGSWCPPHARESTGPALTTPASCRAAAIMSRGWWRDQAAKPASSSSWRAAAAVWPWPAPRPPASRGGPSACTSPARRHSFGTARVDPAVFAHSKERRRAAAMAEWRLPRRRGSRPVACRIRIAVAEVKGSIASIWVLLIHWPLAGAALVVDRGQQRRAAIDAANRVAIGQVAHDRRVALAPA